MPPDLIEKQIEVLTYSGYKANERPIRFVLEGQRREVKKVLKRWSEPDHDYFKVVADDGRKYLLKWNRSADEWFCEM